MPWLMFALGLVLAAGGGAAVVHGYPYMQIEFGWTEVIAGTTALSGGVVTIGIAALLVSLTRLRQAMQRTSAPPAPLIAPALQVDAAPETPAPSMTPTETIKFDGRSAPSNEPQIVPDDKPEERRERAVAKRPDGVRQTRPTTRVVPRPEVPAPTIAGRYESGGSSYVLFSDGTIEVESRTGKRRFGSMDELKSFMAQENQESVSPDA